MKRSRRLINISNLLFSSTIAKRYKRAVLIQIILLILTRNIIMPLCQKFHYFEFLFGMLDYHTVKPFMALRTFY